MRELQEEFAISVRKYDLEKFGSFKAQATGLSNRTIFMETFIVKRWQGTPTANSEVEKILWITSAIPKNIKVGSIFEFDVIPRLKGLELIE